MSLWMTPYSETQMVWEELKDNHRPGDRVCWSTIGGQSYRGVLKEWDNGTAIVVCDDGRERAVNG